MFSVISIENQQNCLHSKTDLYPKNYHSPHAQFSVMFFTRLNRKIISLSFKKMVKIGTHSGHFHADEALACFMLKQLAEYSDAEIVRSRDLKVLAECDIVVDVGATFDPEKKRFDHHQREFAETMKTLGILDFNTKLSSAGLVYAYYGKAVINAVTGLDKASPKMDIVYEKVRKPTEA